MFGSKNKPKVQINPITNFLIVEFKEKPEKAVRKAMRTHGFTWHNERRKWYAYHTSERVKFLKSLK